MWLLNATSEEQKRGISNYFGPVGMSTAASGSGGVWAANPLQQKDHLKIQKPSPAVTMLAPQTNAGEAESEGEAVSHSKVETPVDKSRKSPLLTKQSPHPETRKAGQQNLIKRILPTQNNKSDKPYKIARARLVCR